MRVNWANWTLQRISNQLTEASAPKPRPGARNVLAEKMRHKKASSTQALHQRQVPRHTIRQNASTHGPAPIQCCPRPRERPASGIFSRRVLRHRVRRATCSRYVRSRFASGTESGNKFQTHCGRHSCRKKSPRKNRGQQACDRRGELISCGDEAAPAHCCVPAAVRTLFSPPQRAR